MIAPCSSRRCTSGSSTVALRSLNTVTPCNNGVTQLRGEAAQVHSEIPLLRSMLQLSKMAEAMHQCSTPWLVFGTTVLSVLLLVICTHLSERQALDWSQVFHSNRQTCANASETKPPEHSTACSAGQLLHSCSVPSMHAAVVACMGYFSSQSCQAVYQPQLGATVIGLQGGCK